MRLLGSSVLSFVLLASTACFAHDSFECGGGEHVITIRTEVKCKCEQPNPIFNGTTWEYPEKICPDTKCYEERSETWSDWPSCEGAKQKSSNIFFYDGTTYTIQ